VAGVARRRRLPVRFDERVWHEATRGFSGRALEVAGSTRKRLELEGLALADAGACEAHGADGTRLAGCAKVYLPLGEGTASERPFGMVVQLARDEQRELVWVFVAFGPRHPRPGVRTVYERAHRRLHGRFP
jgi:hypothetical protein